MNELPHWSDDTYWTDAIARFTDLTEAGTTKLTLDLNAIQGLAYDENGPAYKLMRAMVSVWEKEGMDGHRGAPRVMLGLLVRLDEISRQHKGSSSSI